MYIAREDKQTFFKSEVVSHFYVLPFNTITISNVVTPRCIVYACARETIPPANT